MRMITTTSGSIRHTTRAIRPHQRRKSETLSCSVAGVEVCISSGKDVLWGRTISVRSHDLSVGAIDATLLEVVDMHELKYPTNNCLNWHICEPITDAIPRSTRTTYCTHNRTTCSLFGLVFSLSPNTNLAPEFWSQSEVRISWAETGAKIATKNTRFSFYSQDIHSDIHYLLFCASLSIALKLVLRKQWRNR